MQATYNTDHWLLEALLETPKQTKENFQEYDGFTSICCVCKSLAFWYGTYSSRTPGLYRIRGPGVGEIYHANFFWAREAAVVP